MGNMFDQSVEIITPTSKDHIRFTARHLIDNHKRSGDRQGYTVMIIDLDVKNPIYISHTASSDSYSRKKGILTCLQKFIWRHYAIKEKVIYDINEYQFDASGMHTLIVKTRDEFSESNKMWWASCATKHSDKIIQGD